MKARPNRRKPLILRFFSWHRYAGLLAALFVVLLSITGILLNHTEEFALDNHYVDSPALLALYGIEGAALKQSYVLQYDVHQDDALWVSELGEQLFLHDQTLKCDVPLMGAVKADPLLVVANDKQICLFMPSGELVDRLNLAENIRLQAIGLYQGSVIVKSDQGLYQNDPAFSRLQKIPDDKPSIEAEIQWAEKAALPQALQQALQQQHRGQGLPWERVILDLHSGRIFGMVGVYVMDFIALVLIFLGFTGVTMWVRQQLQRRRRR